MNAEIRKKLLTTLDHETLLGLMLDPRMAGIVTLDAGPVGPVQRDVDAVVSLALVEKSINRDRRQARFIASTESVDSYGEVVRQNWRLERYLKNPIALYNHQRGGCDLPIGTAEVEMVSGSLECVITFCTDKASPLVEFVWNSVLERVLRMVSVGFRPKTVRMELLDDKEIYVLDDNELYEISVTPIGANPDALAKAKALAREEFAREKSLSPQQRAASPRAENSMDLQKLAEDRAIKIKELETQLEIATKGADSAVKAHESAQSAVKALTTEKAVLETKIVTFDGVVSTLVKAISDAGIATDPKDGPLDVLSKTIPEILKTNTELTMKTIDQEVEALVGIKISRAEKADFVELRRSNPALYTRMVTARASNGVLAGGLEDKTKAQNIMGGDPNLRAPIVGKGPNPELQEALERSLGDVTANGAGDLGSALDSFLGG